MNGEADLGNGAEELKKALDSPHGLRAIRGVRFRGGAPIAPSGWVIEREAPWHLSAAYMLRLGSCNGEIAKAHGKSPQAVSNLFHQKFFQERVTEIMAANRRDIVDAFKAERFATLAVLIEMRDDPETPANTRALVCREIFDRSMGRPTQHLAVSGEVTSQDPVAEVERLMAETKQLRDSLEPNFSHASSGD